MAKKTLPQKLHDEFRKLNLDGDIKGIDKLLKENKVDLNATLYRIKKNEEEKGGFYLFLEILEGEKIMEKIDYFVKNGANLDVKYDGVNALHKLYETDNHLPVMEKLLGLGIRTDEFNRFGQTLLTSFVRRYTNIYIHNYDAQDSQNWYGNKPEEAYLLSLKFIKLLLKHGADPKIKDANDTSAEDWLLHRKETGEWNHHHEALSKILLN
ncbi:hypothetical protein [Flavivirga jejuensis]|uniref:Ankyrin repeat domain-containing protein n=1 Tax=Flavivirga jejuensis TaxID=870487 RepID=A0ABT8WI84_9FLAO|nr:hypothetical protein [Flavivirga jejuensis]MDO5972672.1 hypothetical protein [Flavivirga jejuensis]